MSTISLRTSSGDYRPYDSFSSEHTIHSHLSAASKAILDCQDCKEQNSTCAFCFIAYAQDPEQSDTKTAHQVFKEIYGFSHSSSAMDIEEDPKAVDSSFSPPEKSLADFQQGSPTPPQDAGIYSDLDTHYIDTRPNTYPYPNLDTILSSSIESPTVSTGERISTGQIESIEIEAGKKKCIFCKSSSKTLDYKIARYSFCGCCYQAFARARQNGRSLDPSRDSLYTAKPIQLPEKEAVIFRTLKELYKKNPRILESMGHLF